MQAVVAPETKNTKVILLHGLLRSRFSMWPVAQYLQRCGYSTLCLGYPSRKMEVSELVHLYLAPLIEQLQQQKIQKIHFVTHSMGGILLRAYLAENHPPELGRIVMMAPPNHGSELVDVIGRAFWFRAIWGPAGCQLTSAADALPAQLGPFPADYPPDSLGIITGNRPSLPIWGWFFHGPNDGRVSVASAQLAGMSDFLVLPYGHSFMMYRAQAQRQTAFFLEHGRFFHQEGENMTKDIGQKDRACQ